MGIWRPCFIQCVVQGRIFGFAPHLQNHLFHLQSCFAPSRSAVFKQAKKNAEWGQLTPGHFGQTSTLEAVCLFEQVEVRCGGAFLAASLQSSPTFSRIQTRDSQGGRANPIVLLNCRQPSKWKFAHRAKNKWYGS